MGTILFIDDEAYFAERYIEELQVNGYKVAFCESAIEAINQIRNSDEFIGVVLDIQMPPPEGLSPQATNDGLDTGMWLLREVKDTIVQRPLPVVILTNRLPKVIQEAVKQLAFPEQLIEVYHKPDTLAKKFAQRVDIQIRRWQQF